MKLTTNLPPALPTEPGDLQVISLDQVARDAGISRRTLDRLIAQGEGPSVIAISSRRRGVLKTDRKRWLLSRRKPAPGDAIEPQSAREGGAT